MIVTNHAIEKWRERTGSKYSEEKVVKKILTGVYTGKEVFPKGKYKVLKLLRHKCEPAKYVYNWGLIFVVVGKHIVTVHKNDVGEFEL